MFCTFAPLHCLGCFRNFNVKKYIHELIYIKLDILTNCFDVVNFLMGEYFFFISNFLQSKANNGYELAISESFDVVRILRIPDIVLNDSHLYVF